MLKKKNLLDNFVVASSGTSREEIGNPVHYKTVSKLNSLGIPVVPHKSVQLKKNDFEYYDYLIGMDMTNLKNMEKIFGGKNDKIFSLLSFANIQRDIKDPWYTGNFDDTYNDIVLGLESFLIYLGH